MFGSCVLVGDKCVVADIPAILFDKIVRRQLASRPLQAHGWMSRSVHCVIVMLVVNLLTFFHLTVPVHCCSPCSGKAQRWSPVSFAFFTHRCRTHWANYVHIGGTDMGGTRTEQIITHGANYVHIVGKTTQGVHIGGKKHRANYVHIGGNNTRQIMYT